MLRRMLLAASLAAVASIGTAQAAVEHYAAPPAADVRAQAIAWVAEQGVTDKTVLESVENLWKLEGDTPAARQVFERTIQTFALVDPETKQFVETCTLVNAPLVPPETDAVFAKPNEFYTDAMRQFLAMYLSQRRMFDESLEQLAQLDPARSLDPASYFYFKAVAEHQLLMKTEGLASIATLLDGVENVPVRYEAVASLMKHELEALQLDSLDEVARKMSDVERRLDLARAGQKVQKREDEIIATLDEIIEKLEQQGGACQGCSGGGARTGRATNQSSSPAQDSTVKGQTAPGDANDRNTIARAGWGNLPAAEQAKAEQEIGRNFPPHYREALKKYSEELARRKAK